jgi:hypothetical protein
MNTALPLVCMSHLVCTVRFRITNQLYDIGAGIFSNTPKQANGAVFRESVVMGSFPGDSREVESIVSTMRSQFPGDSYNLLNNNCNCFAQALVKRLLNRDIPPCKSHTYLSITYMLVNIGLFV